jgi:hypothetical protein
LASHVHNLQCLEVTDGFGSWSAIRSVWSEGLHISATVLKMN